jgi:hypothetical protein
MKARAYTNRILEMIDEEILDESYVLAELLHYLDEHTVAKFYEDTIDDVEAESADMD